MPHTAKVVAVTVRSPQANVLAGPRYLRLMIDRFGGDLELALAAYNAGPTAVENAGAAPSIGTLRYAKNVEARGGRAAAVRVDAIGRPRFRACRRRSRTNE
jgi:soluble lytic murein transglycosylase-like protein